MTSNLRIALFSGNYNYQPDGANKALNRLVRFMEDQGADVLVFSPTSETSAFEHAGTLISVPSVPVPTRGEYRIGFGLPKDHRDMIKAFNPDLFHLSAPDMLGHSALKFSERLGIPAVASFHTRFDTYFKYYHLNWVEPYVRRQMARFYERCARVYAPSASVGRQLREDGIVGDNLELWTRGIERDLFSPAHRDMSWRRDHGIEDDQIALTFVGRLVKEKGLGLFAKIVTALQQQSYPVKALVVGEGPEMQSLRSQLPGAVYTGHLSKTDLSRAYASGDIFINPSRTETFGNVTLEAMASGLPAVCANATGSVDLVAHEQTGLIVGSDDVADWTAAIARLCDEAGLRGRMGRAGREASEAYDWDVIMHSLLGSYHSVLSEHKADHKEPVLS